ncbi:L-threonate dehydrogenase [Tropicibacter alexandrii]|uniref:L-threonate dehydrogenase n=1 Tax=Tropicibacter alexandrii TaxID=2267683 RepID=UPI000EF52BE0|nr:L-threonate dehydrogenase [Tropicibacter alexandrii]
MTLATKLAVIGLGSMGYGMAVNCLRAGLITHGFDIAPGPVERLRAEGGAGGTQAEVAATLDAVLVVVLNAAQTETVLFGEAGIVPHLPKGAVVISSATVAPDFAKGMEARCAEHGVLYLDAPISGGAVRAEAGTLSVMASGSDAAFKAARPVLDAISETVFELGDHAGPGSAMKAVNQLLAGVHIASMAEAMTFGMTQGVSPEKFMEIIPKCAGTSWMLENRGPHIVDGDYTPRSTIDIWPKDLGIVLDIARTAKFGAPVTAAALQQFLAASGMGLGAEDDAALAKLYARNAGLTLPGEE